MVVIPKTVNLARIPQNQDSTKLKLTEEDMTRLTAVDKDFRLYKVRSIFVISYIELAVCISFSGRALPEERYKLAGGM